MTFLTPLALGLGGLALPITALYFLKVRRKRVVVPSVLLWTELSKTEQLATPLQRFQRNLLLLLQLLLLALLALAAARPYVVSESAPAHATVVVVDTSASMGATDGPGGATRLSAAVTEARSLVNSLGPTDEVMIVRAGPVTEVAVPFTADHRELEAGLAALTPSQGAGSLKDGLTLALSLAKSRPGVGVVVLSDGGGPGLDQVQAGGVDVKFVPVGSASQNAAILSIDVRRAPASDLDRQLFVTLGVFGEASDATVEVYLGGKLIHDTTAKLVPDAPTPLVFDLPPRVQGHLEVRIDAAGDVLAADDVAYAEVGEARNRRLLLVGVDALTTRALLADGRFVIDRLSLAGFTADKLDGYDAALFGGPVTADLTGRSFGVLGPFSGGPVKFGGEAPAPQVIGWKRTHPVLRFVGLDGVAIARAKAVADQGGLQSIIDGDVGALALAGERAGARVFELAFQPLESDLPLRVAWPVLVLNLAGWLTDAGDDGGESDIIPAGTPFVRRFPEGVDPGAVKVIGPDGEPVEAQVDHGVLRVQSTDRIGVYETRFGGVRGAFATNLLSESESRISPRTALSLGVGAATQAVATATEGRVEWWRPLALAAMALLLIEQIVYHRRKAA
jgi:Ca-activated chloride channel family protein